MYNKREILSSIPEYDLSQTAITDDVKKWVPKKKHEVLKAKYKCLKKLFQIYDAGVIGMLPPQPVNEDLESIKSVDGTEKQYKRKKRPHRCKADASAGTAESLISCNNAESAVSAETETTAVDEESINATQAIEDLNTATYSCTSTQFDMTTVISKGNVPTCECGCTQTTKFIQYERPKLTRFQSFIQRLFGIKIYEHNRVYASENNLIYREKRKKRGLRFRRFRRQRKTQSDSVLSKNPLILSCVQSVQRNCLTDTTPRQCPFTGCVMMSYGIINYNDHLNLCHFSDRKYVCHYCHEGFENEYDKLIHENEHLGITKLNLEIRSNTATKEKRVCNTQTETDMTKSVEDEKLKKIVSFFDKLSNGDAKKEVYSESNLRNRITKNVSTDNATSTDSSECSDGDKKTVSCVNLRRKIERRVASSGDSNFSSKRSCSPNRCNYCGENFDFRRQLSLHMDLEHRTHEKYSKFHSCVGISNAKPCDMSSVDGTINIQSESIPDRTESNFSQDTLSKETLSCDPSTNIVYYTSNEAFKSVGSFIDKGGYSWEPGTRIIRV